MRYHLSEVARTILAGLEDARTRPQPLHVI
jgi:hypothetical protein